MTMYVLVNHSYMYIHVPIIETDMILLVCVLSETLFVMGRIPIYTHLHSSFILQKCV